MEHIKKTFAQCRQGSRPALVAYVTAGFPTVEETPEIMLALEAGGAGESLGTYILLQFNDNNLLISARHNRTRSPIHRPDRRWPNNPEV